MSKRKGFLVMEDLGDVQRSQKAKKLQIPKPDAYDGSIDANPTYQRWWETINDYLYHNRGTWEGDSDLIRVVGAYISKTRNCQKIIFYIFSPDSKNSIH